MLIREIVNCVIKMITVKTLFVMALIFLNVKVQCCNLQTFEGTKLTALKDIVLKYEVTDYNYFSKAKPSQIIPVEQITGCITGTPKLSDAVAIQIRGQKVPILYEGAVQNLPLLHSLHIVSSEITIVKPGAFQNLPSLTILKMQDNNIESIPSNVFNHLSIKKLVLSFNKISYIASDAFDHMSRLEGIRLDYNRLVRWNAEWFKDCPKVSFLSLKFNQINSLPGGVFTNVQDNLERLYLSNNNIQSISARAFSGLRKLTDLNLSNNNITTLDDTTFLYLERLKMIDLSNTNITCFSDLLLNTLIEDVMIWINNIPLNDTCKTILDEWASDKKSTISFYKVLRNDTLIKKNLASKYFL